MLQDNKITMTLDEFLDLRDKCSEYYAGMKEIVETWKNSGKVVLSDDILNIIYDHISDTSIIEEIEAIQDDGEE